MNKFEKNNKDDVPALLSSGEHVASNAALDYVLGRNIIPAANKIGLQIRASKGGAMKPKNYANGTSGVQGVQLPRLGAKLDQGNGIMGNTAIPGVMKQGNSYSQAKGFKPSLGASKPVAQSMAPFSMPLGYVDGTTGQQGIQPSFMDTVRGIMNAGDEEPMPQQPAPQLGASAPTLEQAKGNYELQNGLPVQKFANGGTVKTPEEAARELQAVEAMKAVPFVRNPVRQPSMIDEATRSVGNVLSDYASRFSSPANAAPQTQPAINQPPAPSPQQPAPQLGAGNINMNQVPSRVSDTGLPYNAVGNTVNFTNPDGTGQGSISERMPVNGGLAARMNDGKGSLSVMKLESPYGQGGRPQEAAPQQVYQASQGQDFSPGISQYMDVLDRSPDMSSLGNMIRDNKVRESAKANLGTLVGLQEQSQGNAIKRDTLGQDQNQFNSQQGLARDQFNREGQQQQFTNKLGLADIGMKQKTAQTEAKRDADKLMLDKIKAAPQAHQALLLDSLSKRLKAGQQDTPAYKEQMRLYEMAFGKRAIDDLGAMQPTQ